MAYNGSGTFVLYTPGNPVVTGTTISDTWANNTLNDLATGLSTAITRDGQSTATARIPFGQGISVGTSITTASTTFDAFAGATVKLNIGGTGATSVTAIPGTLDASGTTGALTVAGGAYVAKSLIVGGTITGSLTGTASGNLVAGGALGTPSSGTLTNCSGPATLIPAASSGVSGYMSGTYATKLDGIASGATNVTNTNQLTNGANFIASGGALGTPSSGTLTNCTGPAAMIPAASSGVNGYMSGTYATKLDGVASGATNVTNTNQLTNGANFIASGGALGTPSSGTLTNCTGPAAMIPAASSGVSGYMSGTYATKLDGVASGATNVTNTNQLTNGAGFITSSGTSAACSGNSVTATTATNLSGGSVAATTITATGNITAYYSDMRLKEVVGAIHDPLGTVRQLRGFLYRGNKLAASFGFDTATVQSGLSAQALEAEVPGATFPAPFDLDESGKSKSGENYLTAKYENVVPLLVECIKELTRRLEALEK